MHESLTVEDMIAADEMRLCAMAIPISNLEDGQDMDSDGAEISQAFTTFSALPSKTGSILTVPRCGTAEVKTPLGRPENLRRKCTQFVFVRRATRGDPCVARGF
ncbi:hypothetical protein SCP_0116640 [Sparassis crispa]|uniref:Uncharacterized protein n=1 Tax=Sparassis crispa TaxID=139825 RepID=A0A401G9C9_9APHY|nr:hypothetical protein SCP_0116640 [Sparassis crispa]GBE78771.1 hypothetical protein SCP_0116640 [Sparassis crispa]